MKNRWRFSLAVIGVVALAIPALPAVAAAAPSATIEDGFDELTPDWLPAAGTWEAADGVARVVQPGASRGSILALSGRGLDGEATATVTFASAGGGASAWAGFTVRRTGTADDYTQSGYTVFVRNSGELAVIRAAGDGQVAVLGTAQTDARPGSGPVTVTASLDGERIRVGLGDVGEATTLIDVTDAAFSGSGFALAAHRDVRMSVDSVQLSGVIDRAEPVPTDCVGWSGAPATDAGRGEVLVSDARIEAVSARIAAGSSRRRLRTRVCSRPPTRVSSEHLLLRRPSSCRSSTTIRPRTVRRGTGCRTTRTPPTSSHWRIACRVMPATARTPRSSSIPGPRRSNAFAPVRTPRSPSATTSRPSFTPRSCCAARRCGARRPRPCSPASCVRRRRRSRRRSCIGRTTGAAGPRDDDRRRGLP